MRWLWATWVNRVGRKNQPCSGSSQAGWKSSAPSATPEATSSAILSSCGLLLIAPTSVFLSIGSPTRRVARRSLSRSTSSSATDSCTSSREPAQHTPPWVEGGVLEHDVGGLAAELERERLVGAGERALDLLADLGGSGEGDLGHVGVADQRHADVARARNGVQHARRQVGLLADVREQERAQRGGGRRLEHDRVAGGEGGRDLPAEHEQREVPRDDLR